MIFWPTFDAQELHVIPKKYTRTSDLHGIPLAQRHLYDTAKNATTVAKAAIGLPKHIYQKIKTNTEPTWIGPWSGQKRSTKRAEYLKNLENPPGWPADERSRTSLIPTGDDSTSSSPESEHSSPPESNFSESMSAITEPQNFSPAHAQAVAYCHGNLHMPSSIRNVYSADNLRYPRFVPEMSEIDKKQGVIKDFHQLAYVPQSEGRASSEFPLVSIGFRECSAIILKNTATGEYLLMHHDSGARFMDHAAHPSNLIEADRFGYRAFMDTPGPKQVLLVEGDYSFDRTEVIQYIVNDGATALPPLKIKSGRRNRSGYDRGEYRWDAIVRPTTGTVIVYLKDINAPAVLSFENIFSDTQ
jgi:hypothetical protein